MLALRILCPTGAGPSSDSEDLGQGSAPKPAGAEHALENAAPAQTDTVHEEEPTNIDWVQKLSDKLDIEHLKSGYRHKGPFETSWTLNFQDSCRFDLVRLLTLSVFASHGFFLVVLLRNVSKLGYRIPSTLFCFYVSALLRILVTTSLCVQR